jgi:hypothetical protein
MYSAPVTLMDLPSAAWPELSAADRSPDLFLEMKKPPDNAGARDFQNFNVTAVSASPSLHPWPLLFGRLIVAPCGIIALSAH